MIAPARVDRVVDHGSAVGSDGDPPDQSVEMRAIDFVTRLIQSGVLSSDDYRKINMHRIAGADPLLTFGASSKLNAEWDFLVHLRDIGRKAARAWSQAHSKDVGVRSTLDLRSEFM